MLTRLSTRRLISSVALRDEIVRDEEEEPLEKIRVGIAWKKAAMEEYSLLEPEELVL